MSYLTLKRLRALQDKARRNRKPKQENPTSDESENSSDDDVDVDDSESFCSSFDSERYYGEKFHRRCKRINPLDPFKLEKMDFIQTTKVKNKNEFSLNVASAVSLYVPGGSDTSYAFNADAQRVYPIVLDTGASISITPLASDFVGEIQQLHDSRVRGLASATTVAGIGTVEWKLRDLHGTIVHIRTKAYYIPEAEIRLFSPQVYFQENDSGLYHVTKDNTVLTLPNGIQLTFPYYAGNNLPMAFEPPTSSNFLSFDDLEEISSRLIALSVLDETNANLSSEKKELIGWHWKLGHLGFQWLRRLMKPRHMESDPNDPTFLRPVILTNFAQTRSCPEPLCAACQIARGHQRGAGTSKETKNPEKFMRLKEGHLSPGQAVSLDQYESRLGGRLPNTKGKEKEEERYHGGTIAVDHASGLIWAQHQVSLRAGETLVTKRSFERFASSFGVKIQKYHSDNGVFKSNAFLEDAKLLGQEIDFSGVGAHHQNGGVDERAIKTISSWARAMLINAAIHWPDMSDRMLSLWPYAMDQAVFLWNNLPSQDNGMAPLEIFSQQKTANDYEHLRRAHTFGCPVFVLDPKLQSTGGKVPKWSPRSKRGMFLGISLDHATSIGRILNLITGSITPQFHVVYDDFFTTVPNADGARAQEEIDATMDWDVFLRDNAERYVLDEVDCHGNPLPVPPLNDEWLTDEEREDIRQREANRHLDRNQGHLPPSKPSQRDTRRTGATSDRKPK
jgi:hypothetical protein